MVRLIDDSLGKVPHMWVSWVQSPQDMGGRELWANRGGDPR
jgi:hypothetical protein